MRRNVSRAIALSAALLTATSALSADRDLRLLDAAKRQDWQAVPGLLKQGIDVNTRQGDGATALHWAVYWNDLAATTLLIRARANVDAANDLGVTPLVLACGNANAAIVEQLLAAGANPNTLLPPTGETPLMTAARTGSVGAAKALLARGANVNAAEDAHGQTALMWAVANRHPAVVRLLIEGGANVHARSTVVRMVVMLAGSESNATDFDAEGFTPLLFAARQGDLESARVLVAAGARVNDAAPDTTSVLVLAAHSGQTAVANYLLEQGADPNAEASGYTALQAAVLRGDLELVTALLARGADPNVMLKQATQVRRTSKDFALSLAWIGATPFWLAANFGEPAIMRALAAGGADPNMTIPDGTTPLMVAANSGLRGSTSDRRGRRRDTSEIDAGIETGEEERIALETVKAVIDIGANVNAVNEAGNTAVHIATTQKATSVVQYLADHGAKLDVRNNRGQTPLSIANTFTRRQAEEGGIDTKMVELLRRLGVSQ